MKIINYTKSISLAYYYAELESYVKTLLKKNWLNESDSALVSSEFEKLKQDYKKLEQNFNYEEGTNLIIKMKEMPVKTFLVKKEKYLTKFEVWKSTIEKSVTPNTLVEITRAKELLDKGTITREEFEIIKTSIFKSKNTKQ